MKVEKKEPQNLNDTCFSERALNLFGLSKRKLRSDLITTSKYLHKKKLQDIKELFTLVKRHKKNQWLEANAREIQMRHEAHTHHCENGEPLQQTGKGKYFPSSCLQTRTGHFSERYDLAGHKLCFSQTNYWVQYRGNREKFNGLWYMTDETRWTNAHPKAKLYQSIYQCFMLPSIATVSEHFHIKSIATAKSLMDFKELLELSLLGVKLIRGGFLRFSRGGQKVCIYPSYYRLYITVFPLCLYSILKQWASDFSQAQFC